MLYALRFEYTKAALFREMNEKLLREVFVRMRAKIRGVEKDPFLYSYSATGETNYARSFWLGKSTMLGLQKRCDVPFLNFVELVN